MKILKSIPVLLVFAVILSGCGEIQKKNQWEDTRLEELVPKERRFRADKAIVGLSIYVLQFNAGKYPQVLEAMHQANNLPISYDDTKNFAANQVICGGGDMNTWAKISKSLADSNTTVIKRINIYMDEDTSEVVEVAQLTEGGSISYRTGDNAWAVMGLPQGSIVLDITTKSLIGLKQACKLEVRPIYKTSVKKLRVPRRRGWEFAFDSINFSANVRPGQFVFLAPEMKDTDASKQDAPPVAGRMIFYSDGDKPVVRFCLIACGLIND